MALELVLCPACGTNNGAKHGRSEAGKQRHECRNPECNGSTDLRDYIYRATCPMSNSKFQTWRLTAVESEITIRFSKSIWLQDVLWVYSSYAFDGTKLYAMNLA